MPIPVVIHRWFAAEGEAWAYHTSIEPRLRSIRAGLSGQISGTPSDLELVHVETDGVYLVAVRTEDPDRQVDEFDRPISVLRVAVLRGKPVAGEVRIIQSELRRLELVSVPGANDALVIDAVGHLNDESQPTDPPVTPTTSTLESSSGRSRSTLLWFAGAVIASGIAILVFLNRDRVIQTREISISAATPGATQTSQRSDPGELDQNGLDKIQRQLFQDIDLPSSLTGVIELVHKESYSRLLAQRPARIAEMVANRIYDFSRADGQLAAVLDGSRSPNNLVEEYTDALVKVQGLRDGLLRHVDKEQYEHLRRKYLAIQLNYAMSIIALQYTRLFGSVENMEKALTRLQHDGANKDSRSVLESSKVDLEVVAGAFSDSVRQYEQRIEAESALPYRTESLLPSEVQDAGHLAGDWVRRVWDPMSWRFRVALNRQSFGGTIREVTLTDRQHRGGALKHEQQDFVIPKQFISPSPLFWDRPEIEVHVVDEIGGQHIKVGIPYDGRKQSRDGVDVRIEELTKPKLPKPVDAFTTKIWHANTDIPNKVGSVK